MENSGSGGSSAPETSSRSVFFAINLNETPPSSPREISAAGGLGLSDVNASLPREADVVNSELALAASSLKTRDMHESPFIGLTLNSSRPHLGPRAISSTNASFNPVRIAQMNLEIATQNANSVYLRALKDYVSEKRGVLGEGWHVKFEFSGTNCNTSPVYCAPDGCRFGSMVEVAAHLGLPPTWDSGGNGGNAVEVEPPAGGNHAPESFLDCFPIQFEDFFVTSLGKIDPRPSFHTASRIFPVDYKSVWHDRLTGSVFVFNVLDGGDSAPVFRIHRHPCTKHPIPAASTVLLGRRQKPATASGDSAGTDDGGSSSSLGKMRSCLTTELPRARARAHHRDTIGGFSLEARTPTSAWNLAVDTLVLACRHAFRDTGVLAFVCDHEDRFGSSYGSESLDKFFRWPEPLNVVATIDEFKACCERVREWLRPDRFGLDAEFVQELMERLPGVGACSQYEPLHRRRQNPVPLTVGGGFLSATRKDDHRPVIESLKRPRPPGNTVISVLPRHLTGDILQANEFLLRFRRVLGQDSIVSLENLEFELTNARVSGLDPPSNGGTVNPHGSDRVEDLTSSSTATAAATDRGGGDSDGPTGGAAVVADYHIALLKVVVEETLARVGEVFDPFAGGGGGRRRGGKRNTGFAVYGKKTRIDMVPAVNEITWPEMARRLVLVAVSVGGGTLEGLEMMPHECPKVFECLNGDGGTIGGSLTGVAAMEADAVVLAEATKKIFPSSKMNVFDFPVDGKDVEETETETDDNGTPEWIAVLEPVRKLPTNVGARIRNCVRSSLAKQPPDWATERLTLSISKDVYKGNAAGPTKRIVVEVLERVRLEDPGRNHARKKAAGHDVKTVCDAVTKRCRIVLRSVAVFDEKRIAFNRVAKSVRRPNESGEKGFLGYPTMVSRPLDFRTVDLRLAAGVYGDSHESFIEDVREIWRNLRVAYHGERDRLDHIESLRKKFEESYEQEVLTLVHDIVGFANGEPRTDLNAILGPTIEAPLPAAPWEDGICKSCGVDRDDDGVLLCDKCDSEYHKYCLDPPLSRVPKGNWFCPSCVPGPGPGPSDRRCGSRALWCRKKKVRGGFTRDVLEALAGLADTMESVDYWEIGIEERVFLLKFLCDEALNSEVVRKELKPRNKSEDPSGLTCEKDGYDDEGDEEYQLETPRVSKSQSQSQSQTQNGDETDENGRIGATREGRDQDCDSEAYGAAAAAAAAENGGPAAGSEPEQRAAAVRRAFLGRDSSGRLYWVFDGPERVVVADPQSRDECVASSGFLSHEKGSSWACYESDAEIDALVGWLSGGNREERELEKTILDWRRTKKPDDPEDRRPNNIQGKPMRPSIHHTNARAALEKKFGSFGAGKFPTKGKIVHANLLERCSDPTKGKTVHGNSLERCSDPTKGKTVHGNSLERCSDPTKGKTVHGNSIERCSDPTKGKTVHGNSLERCSDGTKEAETGSPFVFEEIRANFSTRGSLKDEIRHIGLLGSNGTPSFIHQVPPPDHGNGSTDLHPSQSSPKPLLGKPSEILKFLKTILLDIESALPQEALRPSRTGPGRLCGWRGFVKSSQSIHEMVQATIVMEEMIRTEYLRKEWWYWSSPSAAANISTVSALALRIYALDAAVCHQPTTPRGSGPKPTSRKRKFSED